MFEERKKTTRKKGNNAGMTLVEVIIAITILALVAIPVLHSMTSSMYYNAKARNRQSITLAAESLMETFKGYDLESLQEMFIRAEAGEALAKAELGVTDADGFEYPSDLSATELVFKVNGMKADDGKTTCDVEIKASKQGIKEVMEIENILPERDAIFREQIDYEDEEDEEDEEKDALATAQMDFQSHYQTEFLNRLNELDEREWELTQSDIDWSCLTLQKRELGFVVSGSGEQDVVTAYMEYTYYIKEHKYYEKVETPTESEEEPESEAEPESEEEAESEPYSEAETVTMEERRLTYPENEADYFKVRMNLSDYIPAMDGEYTIYSNAVQAGVHPLQRLLIYYYPVYSLEKADSIVIQNPDALSLDCYLIKQKAPGLTSTQLQIKETNYKPSVKCEGAGNVVLYHNLNTNLDNKSEIAGGASGITSFSEVQEYAGDFFKKEKVLVYKLEMTVSNDGKEIASFEGTMDEYMDN